MKQHRYRNGVYVEPCGIKAVGCDESQSTAEWRTRDEVAAVLGVSTKRIQQIETELLRALRWPPGDQRTRARQRRR